MLQDIIFIAVLPHVTQLRLISLQNGSNLIPSPVIICFARLNFARADCTAPVSTVGESGVSGVANGRYL